jgi:peptidoglycan hydrolase-like protein with peptidoglycan-binding domain
MLNSAGFNARDRVGYNPNYKNPGDPVGHKGLDLHALLGADYLAAADGEIGHAGWRWYNWSAGIQIDIVLPFKQGVGGWVIRGLHLDEVLVKAGDRVKAGQVIGRIGKTGLANLPHLHIEVRWLTVPYNPSRDSSGQGIPVDPMRFGILERECDMTPTPGVWPRLLRPGEKHPVVPLLKALLVIVGERDTAGKNQRYGGAAVKQVKALQASLGITVDGIVGPDTRTGLYARVAATNREV